MTARGYDSAFMRYAAQSSAYAAHEIASRLKQALGVASVLDVGCAAGTWLRVWSELGVADTQGVDGHYVDEAMLEIPGERFKAYDLKKPFDLGRRFDLVQCLEVAEHLPSETSSALIATLAAHAERFVLFSAASPGQGGECHVNERAYDFWRHEFDRQGFKAYDFVRPAIAGDQAISFWYRYNIVLYVRERATDSLPSEVAATALASDSAIADISPPLFQLRKAIVRTLPASVQNQLARTKARLIGHGPESSAARASAFVSTIAATAARRARALTAQLFDAAGFTRPSNPLPQIWLTVAGHLKLDLPIGLIAACYLALFMPLVARNTANPQLNAAFVNDEPFLVMALEATAVHPWGNPANYFDLRRSSSQRIPEHWGYMRYYEFFYYGGSLYQIAFPFYAVGRIAGLPSFPTAAIILRTICLLAGLGTLIVLYNIFKARGSRLAGGMAACYLTTDTGFHYYVTYVHHDALQCLFGLLAFVFGARHARLGDWPSLAGLGIFCGLVQGTKVGGPWLAPMAALAVALGIFYARRAGAEATPRSSETPALPPAAQWWSPARNFLARCLILGCVGTAAFFASTPYAAVDTYYWRSLLATFTMVSYSPIGVNPTLWSWVILFRDHLGIWLTVLAGLGLVRAFVSLRRPVPDLSLILAIVLACSQVLWFGLVGKFWHIISYLLVAQALLSGIAIETLAVIGRRTRDLVQALLPQAARWARPVAIVAAAATAVVAFEPRWDVPVHSAMKLHQSNTVVSLGDWAAAGGLDHNASILYDDLAYFDPARFPKARMRGGVLTWPQVEAARPDVVVLSSSLYDAEWYRKLRATQTYDRWNPDPSSMRLYQDLLRVNEPGPTGIPGFELVKIVRPARGYDRPDQPPQPTIARLAEVWRAGKAAFAQTAASFGPELRVFRLAPAGTPDGRPAGFAVGSAAGFPAAFAFDATSNPWRCKATGEAAKSCSIGFDFGGGAEVSVRRLRIRWETEASRPAALRLEFSDDGSTWTEATALALPAPEGGAATGKEEVLPIPDRGRHRYWRMVPLEVKEGVGFAVSEMAFLEQP